MCALGLPAFQAQAQLRTRQPAQGNTKDAWPFTKGRGIDPSGFQDWHGNVKIIVSETRECHLHIAATFHACVKCNAYNWCRHCVLARD